MGTRVGDAPGAALAAAFGPALEAGTGPAAEDAPAEVLAAAEEGAVAPAWGLEADVSTFSGCLGALAAACSQTDADNADEYQNLSKKPSVNIVSAHLSWFVTSQFCFAPAEVPLWKCCHNEFIADRLQFPCG